MKLSDHEKSILNTLFKNVSGTTRNTMLCTLYAAKPADDGTSDAQDIITTLNGLILKVYNAEPEEMETVFAGIPYDI